MLISVCSIEISTEISHTFRGSKVTGKKKSNSSRKSIYIIITIISY